MLRCSVQILWRVPAMELGAEGLRLLEPISQAKRTDDRNFTVLLLSGELTHVVGSYLF